MSVAHNIEEKIRTDDIQISESVDFSGLLLSQPVLEGLSKAGFKRPSPIQLKAIPLGRCGLDLIVQAKSGTGKTCVFTVIALEGLDLRTDATQVLILAPTREIAIQISSVVSSIGACLSGLKSHSFIGGTSIYQDKISAKHCHIATGTPGRIKQLIELGVLKTASIRLFVLDEADKLLDGCFTETINWIYSSLPDNKQILALSATYPEILAQHLTWYMRNPTFVRLNITDPALIGIKQYHAIVPDHPLPNKVFDAKTEVVVKILSSVSFQQCLIFSNLQTRAQNLQSDLQSRNWPTECIAGCLDQKDRTLAMEQLKAYKCRILISTDLTSRGIDADKVNMVINLDVPKDHETYLHRIGRAGRFGSHGAAITVVSKGRQEKELWAVERKCKTHIPKLPDPIPGDLATKLVAINLSDVVTTETIITRTDPSLKLSTPSDHPANRNKDTHEINDSNGQRDETIQIDGQALEFGKDDNGTEDKIDGIQTRGDKWTIETKSKPSDITVTACDTTDCSVEMSEEGFHTKCVRLPSQAEMLASCSSRPQIILNTHLDIAVCKMLDTLDDDSSGVPEALRSEMMFSESGNEVTNGTEIVELECPSKDPHSVCDYDKRLDCIREANLPMREEGKNEIIFSNNIKDGCVSFCRNIKQSRVSASELTGLQGDGTDNELCSVCLQAVRMEDKEEVKEIYCNGKENIGGDGSQKTDNLGGDGSQKTDNLGGDGSQKTDNLGGDGSQKTDNLGGDGSQKTDNLGGDGSQKMEIVECLEDNTDGTGSRKGNDRLIETGDKSVCVGVMESKEVDNSLSHFSLLTQASVSSHRDTSMSGSSVGCENSGETMPMILHQELCKVISGSCNDDTLNAIPQMISNKESSPASRDSNTNENSGTDVQPRLCPAKKTSNSASQLLKDDTSKPTQKLSQHAGTQRRRKHPKSFELSSFLRGLNEASVLADSIQDNPVVEGQNLYCVGLEGYHCDGIGDNRESHTELVHVESGSVYHLEQGVPEPSPALNHFKSIKTSTSCMTNSASFDELNPSGALNLSDSGVGVTSKQKDHFNTQDQVIEGMEDTTKDHFNTQDQVIDGTEDTTKDHFNTQDQVIDGTEDTTTDHFNTQDQVIEGTEDTTTDHFNTQDQVIEGTEDTTTDHFNTQDQVIEGMEDTTTDHFNTQDQVIEGTEDTTTDHFNTQDQVIEGTEDTTTDHFNTQDQVIEGTEDTTTDQPDLQILVHEMQCDPLNNTESFSLKPNQTVYKLAQDCSLFTTERENHFLKFSELVKDFDKFRQEPGELSQKEISESLIERLSDKLDSLNKLPSLTDFETQGFTNLMDARREIKTMTGRVKSERNENSEIVKDFLAEISKLPKTNHEPEEKQHSGKIKIKRKRVNDRSNVPRGSDAPDWRSKGSSDFDWHTRKINDKEAGSLKSVPTGFGGKKSFDDLLQEQFQLKGKRGEKLQAVNDRGKVSVEGITKENWFYERKTGKTNSEPARANGNESPSHSVMSGVCRNPDEECQMLDKMHQDMLKKRKERKEKIAALKRESVGGSQGEKPPLPSGNVAAVGILPTGKDTKVELGSADVRKSKGSDTPNWRNSDRRTKKTNVEEGSTSQNVPTDSSGEKSVDELHQEQLQLKCKNGERMEAVDDEGKPTIKRTISCHGNDLDKEWPHKLTDGVTSERQKMLQEMNSCSRVEGPMEEQDGDNVHAINKEFAIKKYVPNSLIKTQVPHIDEIGKHSSQYVVKTVPQHVKTVRLLCKGGIPSSHPSLEVLQFVLKGPNFTDSDELSLTSSSHISDIDSDDENTEPRVGGYPGFFDRHEKYLSSKRSKEDSMRLSGSGHSKTILLAKDAAKSRTSKSTRGINPSLHSTSPLKGQRTVDISKTSKTRHRNHQNREANFHESFELNFTNNKNKSSQSLKDLSKQSKPSVMLTSPTSYVVNKKQRHKITQHSTRSEKTSKRAKSDSNFHHGRYNNIMSRSLQSSRDESSPLSNHHFNFYWPPPPPTPAYWPLPTHYPYQLPPPVPSYSPHHYLPAYYFTGRWPYQYQSTQPSSMDPHLYQYQTQQTLWGTSFNGMATHCQRKYIEYMTRVMMNMTRKDEETSDSANEE